MFFVLVITGCSLSKINDTSVSVINGYAVPPMPDRTLNGVDSDNNGIRDDIDRYDIIKTF